MILSKKKFAGNGVMFSILFSYSRELPLLLNKPSFASEALETKNAAKSKLKNLKILKIKLKRPPTADLLKGLTKGAFAIFDNLSCNYFDISHILKINAHNCNIFFVGKEDK